MANDRRYYGWKRDRPDRRDYRFTAPPLLALPTVIDLRPAWDWPVYDQGQLGSCTANAVGGAIEFEQAKQQLGAGVFVPSRLQIYYDERVIEGTVNSDAGASIRDSIKVAAQGYAHEALWPYVIGNFAAKPPPAVYTDAAQNKVSQYLSVAQEATSMKSCLAAGYPLVLGFTVHTSFESQAVASTGIVPLPATGEKVLGGHAVLCVGYDDITKRFLCRNSWGDKWGQKGYFTMPYDYLTNPQMAADFWTVRVVSQPGPTPPTPGPHLTGTLDIYSDGTWKPRALTS